MRSYYIVIKQDENGESTGEVRDLEIEYDDMLGGSTSGWGGGIAEIEECLDEMEREAQQEHVNDLHRAKLENLVVTMSRILGYTTGAPDYFLDESRASVEFSMAMPEGRVRFSLTLEDLEEVTI